MMFDFASQSAHESLPSIIQFFKTITSCGSDFILFFRCKIEGGAKFPRSLLRSWMHVTMYVRNHICDGGAMAALDAGLGASPGGAIRNIEFLVDVLAPLDICTSISFKNIGMLDPIDAPSESRQIEN